MGTRFRRAFVPVASLFKNATSRYVGGVFLLLLSGVVAVWAAQAYIKSNDTARVLLQAFGEAALVSSALAILVDPHLKRRLQAESARGVLFGFLNPRAPKELREAILELATCTRYYTNAAWSISFAWHDEAKTILAITLEVIRTGYNIGPEPYRPHGRPWVLASTHGYQTEYLRYALSCPGHITSIDLRGADLQPYVVRKEDGSAYLEESRLPGSRAIPPEARFESINRTKMYQHAAGYIPLQYENFFTSLTFTLGGPALDEFYVTIRHPGQDKRSLPVEWRRFPAQARSPAARTFGHATPGQVSLVSWGLASGIGDL